MTKNEQKNVIANIDLARSLVRKARICSLDAWYGVPEGTAVEAKLNLVAEVLRDCFDALAECYVSVSCSSVETDCLSEEGGLE